MERGGVLDSGRAAGDRVGGGSAAMERDRTRSLLGQLGSGGDRVDGGNNLERAHKRPMGGLGSGSATSQGARTGAARPHAGQGEPNRACRA